MKSAYTSSMRLHLDEAAVQRLEEMAKVTKLGVATIASQLVDAGLRALPEGKLVLPLEFQMKQERREKAQAA